MKTTKRLAHNRSLAYKVLLPSVLSVGFSFPALAADVTKSATGTDLFDGASWGGTAPTAADIAVWESTSLGSALTLGSDASWDGIRVNGALSDIDITGVGKLTLGQGGINTAGSGVNFSIANAITLGSMGSWWTADTGKSITASGVISGAGTLNLGSRGIAVNTYLTSTATTIATNTSLSSITSVSGLMNGGYIGYSAGSDAYKFTNDGTTATYQLRILDGGYTKSVGIELKQSGSDITGKVLYAKYLSGSNLTTDFDTAGTTGTIATSDGGAGYGSRLASLVFTPAANEQGTITLSGNNTFTGGVAIHAGTVKIGNINAFGQTSTRTNVGTVVVGSGATVDFNGVADAQYGYTISGTGVGGAGALINTGAAITSNLRQASNIALNADASIGGTTEWSLIANAYAATNLYLNGHTLTKTGANTIGLVNTTLNAGTVQVSQGTLTLGIASSGINGAAAATPFLPVSEPRFRPSCAPTVKSNFLAIWGDPADTQSPPTWREYFDEYEGIDMDNAQLVGEWWREQAADPTGESIAIMAGDEIGGAALKKWQREQELCEGSSARARRLLLDLPLDDGSDPAGGHALGKLRFVESVSHGSLLTYVEASDLATLACLQNRLNELGQGLAIEIRSW